MPVFSAPSYDAHEEVAFFHDAAAGLKAIVAIHDTRLGPALGGCRMYPYEDDHDALDDVLRLARGMTYKSALARLPLGGGKSVVIGDPKRKTEALLAALGRSIDSLGGRYIVAEDVGTTVADMSLIRRVTPHVAGHEGAGGDPSPATALGVFEGIRAAVRHRLRRDGLRGLRVAVQGLGAVGWKLAERLAAAGAGLVVTDVDADRVERAVRAFGAEAVAPDDIYDAEAEVFAPCALGAVLNDETVPRLRAAIVAGSANNQLAEDRHGGALAARGILYAPDYAINAGGIIQIAYQLPGASGGREAAFAAVRRIADTLAQIFARAEREGLPTNLVADHIAEERLRRERRVA